MIRNRILFIKATTSPVGGVGTWLDHAVPELAERGFDPVVCLTRGLVNHLPARYLEARSDLKCLIVDGRGLNREGRIRACQRVIKQVQPTIVLPLGVLDATDAAFRIRDKGKPIHVVGRAQGNLPPMLADLESRKDGFDHIVCDGNMTRQFLTNYAGFEPQRVTHIPNGADTRTHPHIALGTNQPLRLGYVGRLTRGDKRVQDIPRLCKILGNMGVDYHLTVAGTGPCEGEIRAELSSFGKRITFLGSQPGTMIYSDILPNLDILLLFSSSETFGIVLLEAMMNGVVPVTSKYIGFQSERLVVEERHGLAFDVGDIQSAAAAILRLDQDRSLLRRFSAAAYDHAISNYSWKRCFDQWAEVLSLVADSTPVPTCPELSSRVTKTNNRLDRLKPPSSLVDMFRRIRRTIVGFPVGPGGEEWPLFSREHSLAKLDQIKKQCIQLEDTAHRSLG